jgi:ribosomal protein S12 methylthiotransferase
VGFPGETEADVEELERFLVAARLDAVGVFGYSDEEGTEAAGYDGKLPDDVVRERVERVAALVEELTTQRAEDRHGETVEVLVEHVEDTGEGLVVEGRSAHQAPEVDGSTMLVDGDVEVSSLRVGDIVSGVVVGSDGVDLVASVTARTAR